ncbi:MAG: hypothetical protein M3452_03730 [Chloroflexota bacterium]|nr:hypothetical protein [Chloroflexota bacterium]
MGSVPPDDSSGSPVEVKDTPPRRDRYGSLMDSLRAGEPEAARPTDRLRVRAPAARRGIPAIWRGWHPVARTFLVVAVIVALGYVALLFANEYLRASRIDSWAGPDASVQSGLALAGCPVAEGHGDEAFPSWIRYRDDLYASTGRVAPIGTAWQYGQTRYAESDYRLGNIRLLLEEPAAGAAPASVLLLQEPAPAARIYDRIDCP